MTRTWNTHLAEFKDTRQRSQMKRRRPCEMCGHDTQAVNGVCLSCQPSLLDVDEPADLLRAGDSMVQPGEPWPKEMF